MKIVNRSRALEILKLYKSKGYNYLNLQSCALLFDYVNVHNNNLSKIKGLTVSKISNDSFRVTTYEALPQKYIKAIKAKYFEVLHGAFVN